MRHPGKDRSLARRLATPLGLSLTLHALLVATLLLVRSPSPPGVSPPGGVERSPFTLHISGPSRPRPQPRAEPPRPLGPEYIPVGIEPILRVAHPATRAETAPGGGGTASTGGIIPAPASPPAPRFFKTPGTARRIVYLLDCSMSMGDKLDVARADLTASLRHLPPATHFQVIPYNRIAQPLRLRGQTGLVPADPPTITEAIRLLDELSATGATNHRSALQRGLALKPDLLFLATDADDLTEADVRDVTAQNRGGAAIHVIDLAPGRPRADSLLARLARENRGLYRRLELR